MNIHQMEKKLTSRYHDFLDVVGSHSEELVCDDSSSEECRSIEDDSLIPYPFCIKDKSSPKDLNRVLKNISVVGRLSSFELAHACALNDIFYANIVKSAKARGSSKINLNPTLVLVISCIMSCKMFADRQYTLKSWYKLTGFEPKLLMQAELVFLDTLEYRVLIPRRYVRKYHEKFLKLSLTEAVGWVDLFSS
eukprot:gnl/Carplike_NY0171/5293_a7221_355.p1 GENE.gnl/Carplike_NY0171/5293_a7221_355~~gnl/Carplike_NY0171/5293_a7221_355.p1  ORF type:complete len:210 (-),score=13.34 gnl/Carplike_NY0171/5293_a7221_355:613-1191(-)